MLTLGRATSKSLENSSDHLSKKKVLEKLNTLNQDYLDLIDKEVNVNKIDPRGLVDSIKIEMAIQAVSIQAEPLMHLLGKSNFFKNIEIDGRKVTHIQIGETKFKVNKVKKKESPNLITISQLKDQILGNE